MLNLMELVELSSQQNNHIEGKKEYSYLQTGSLCASDVQLIIQKDYSNSSYTNSFRSLFN